MNKFVLHAVDVANLFIAGCVGVAGICSTDPHSVVEWLEVKAFGGYISVMTKTGIFQDRNLTDSHTAEM